MVRREPEKADAEGTLPEVRVAASMAPEWRHRVIIAIQNIAQNGTPLQCLSKVSNRGIKSMRTGSLLRPRQAGDCGNLSAMPPEGSVSLADSAGRRLRCFSSQWLPRSLTISLLIN